MPTIVKMPQLGESVVEGTVARWLKGLGDSIDKLEPLLEVSTDKIDTEVPSPASGVLLKIIVAEGETVDTGTTLAYIGEAGEQLPDDATNSEHLATIDGGSKITKASPVRPSQKISVGEKPSGRGFISPVVARIVAEHNVDIEQVLGTGMGGRVTKKDILAFIDKRQAPSHQPSDVSYQPPAAGHQPPATNDETLHPLTTMRRFIAQHMVQSKATSPHVTTVFEVDMTAVVRHQAVHKTQFAEKGLRLTFTPYFVAATAEALKAVPQVNSRFTDEGIITNRRIHIGVAVSLDEGLIVPVVRDADEKNLQGLARSVNEVAARARGGNLGIDETQGGTFTITNYGVSGSLIGTPIINQPQTGILGVGAIVKRPVVRSSTSSLLPDADDAIVIRPMCYLSLTFDHRVLDGAEADRFVSVIKEKLENWENL